MGKLEAGRTISLFIRVSAQFYSAQIDEGVEHPLLAKRNDILGEVQRLLGEVPTNVDAGLVVTDNVNGVPMRLYYGDSKELGLPKLREAREQTAQIDKEQHPNDKITYSQQFTIYP